MDRPNLLFTLLWGNITEERSSKIIESTQRDHREQYILQGFPQQCSKIYCNLYFDLCCQNTILQFPLICQCYCRDLLQSILFYYKCIQGLAFSPSSVQMQRMFLLSANKKMPRVHFKVTIWLCLNSSRSPKEFLRFVLSSTVSSCQRWSLGHHQPGYLVRELSKHLR